MISLYKRHEGKFKNGPVHNFLGSLRVAPKKEGTAVLSLYFPHSKFFELDAAFNVTVPTFDSCTAALRLIEKSANDYAVRYIYIVVEKTQNNFDAFSWTSAVPGSLVTRSPLKVSTKTRARPKRRFII